MFFCGVKCIYDRDEEGAIGISFGNQIICTGCLEDLKEALDINEPKEELGY